MELTRLPYRGEFDRVNKLDDCRVFAEEFRGNPSVFVFCVPGSVAFELLLLEVLDPSGAVAWSLWDRYLREGSGLRLQSDLAESGIPFVQLHTSGHASVADLQRLVEALAPARLVPMHSEATDRAEEFSPRVERHDDGERWDV